MSAPVYEKALALMRRSQTCVIGSIDKDGFPALRAMLRPREWDGMNQIFFSTNTSSQHVREYRENPAASVYFHDPELFEGLLLRGRMEVTADQTLRDRLWRDGDNLYYQLGPADPEYSVMLFTASNGRWYKDLKSSDLKIH